MMDSFPTRFVSTLKRFRVAGSLLIFGLGLSLEAAEPSDLFKAISAGNESEAMQAIDQGVPATSVDSYGYSVLQRAVVKNLTNVVATALTAGANPNLPTPDGFFPIQYPASRGQENLLRLLLSAKANVDVADKKGITPLMNASGHSNVAIISLLLKEGADIKARTDLKMTPFLIACERGTPSTLKLLLKQGAPMDAVDIFGEGALSKAAANGKIENVDFLLSEGVEVDGKDDRGDTAFMASVSGIRWVANSNEIWDMSKSKSPPLTIRPNSIYINVADRLLKAGADINAKDSFNYTPLMRAARYGRSDAIEYLVQKGADINLKNSMGHSALMTAAIYGQTRALEKLIALGADVGAMNASGDTAADMIRKENYTRMVVKSGDTTLTVTIRAIKNKDEILAVLEKAASK